MTTNERCIQVDPQHVAQALRPEVVAATEGELVLDFSAVLRVDAEAVRALEDLAIAAQARSEKIVLRGVHIDVYRVLKLMKLTTRFRFLN